MEYYGNKLCISARELVDGGIMTLPNYKQLSARGRIDVVRRGGGASGSYALVAVDSLPTAYKERSMRSILEVMKSGCVAGSYRTMNLTRLQSYSLRTGLPANTVTKRQRNLPGNMR